jgi:hypothetical protein
MVRIRLWSLGAAMGLVLAQCAPACQPDPGYPLLHSFSLSPGVQAGLLTDCVRRDSDVEGRQDYCRVVFGHEESGDTQNFHLDFPPSATDPSGADPVILASSGSNDHPFGISLVLSTGAMYEGCRWISPTNDYDCDYQVAKPFVMRTGGVWDYVLTMAWNWAGSQAEMLGCASGIVGIWYGGRITLPLLYGCKDGPL